MFRVHERPEAWNYELSTMRIGTGKFRLYIMSMVDKIIYFPLVGESDMPEMSIPLPALEIPTESSDVRLVQVSQNIVDRSTWRRFASMPNIHIRFEVTRVNLEQGTCNGSRDETRQRLLELATSTCSPNWQKYITPIKSKITICLLIFFTGQKNNTLLNINEYLHLFQC